MKLYTARCKITTANKTGTTKEKEMRSKLFQYKNEAIEDILSAIRFLLTGNDYFKMGEATEKLRAGQSVSVNVGTKTHVFSSRKKK